jgi:TM2 domain-containing membrane protein YozV
MIINIIYILIFLIFSFLTYLIVKSIIRGVEVKNKIKKISLKM